MNCMWFSERGILLLGLCPTGTGTEHKKHKTEHKRRKNEFVRPILVPLVFCFVLLVFRSPRLLRRPRRPPGRFRFFVASCMHSDQRT